MREGEYLGTITQIQTWGDYLRDIANILNSSPRELPGAIPVINTGSCQ
jgi:hypothetical protein